ncbi:HAMP domain-containing histidine kinase [Candidatus Binatia bacterium]|nr:HAMP domain-containing histidine kinase [Candidatus Binatia bacterium]
MTDEAIKVLLVEDDPAEAGRAREYLVDRCATPFGIVAVGTLAAARARLAEERFDAVVLDLDLPDSRGLDTLTQIRSVAGDVPIVILSALDSEETGVAAVRAGAQEYLVKEDVLRGVLARSVQQAIARRALQQELTQRTQQLEAANRLKDLFVDVMRHDLLDQVAAILGAADLLLAHEGDDESQDLLRTVVQRAERLAGIIRAATLYAKLQGPEELPKERLDLSALIRAAVAEVRQLVAEKQQRVTIRCAPESYAMVNPILQNALVQLLRNAVRYSPPGRRIDVSLGEADFGYRIAVTDWGDGIPSPERESLFSRLERPDRAAAKGTGLGVAIVKRVADLHGGRVGVAENPEGGSVFTIDLPRT